MRVTMVASISGVYPSMIEEPFIIGTPARQTVSLSTMRLPLRGPSGAPRTSVFTYQAFSGFSDKSGKRPGERG